MICGRYLDYFKAQLNDNIQIEKITERISVSKITKIIIIVFELL